MDTRRITKELTQEEKDALPRSVAHGKPEAEPKSSIPELLHAMEVRLEALELSCKKSDEIMYAAARRATLAIESAKTLVNELKLLRKQVGMP